MTRPTADVMILVPAASWASRMIAIEAYLPVPTMSRDVTSLPPSTRLVSHMPLPSTHGSYDLDLVAVAELHRGVRRLRRDLAVDGDGRVLALDVEESEQALDGEPGLDIHRLAVDVNRHRHKRPLPLTGAAVLTPAAVFPSPALSGSGSRGPGPHPVLRNPPPTTTRGVYTRGLLSSRLADRLHRIRILQRR